MRLKIRVDVRKPLKRKKNIVKKDKPEVVVNFKYEKLGEFCFICGLLSYTERFCKKKLDGEGVSNAREWGLGCVRHRAGEEVGAKVSGREESNGEWRSKDGKDKITPYNSGRTIPRNTHAGIKITDKGVKIGDFIVNTGQVGSLDKNSNVKEGKFFNTSSNETEEEEFIGLMFDERKKTKK